MLPGFLPIMLLSSASFAIELNLTVPPCTNSAFGWTFNQNHYSPCQVSAALESVCSGGTWSIRPISGSEAYAGPFQGADNQCQCNTVVFSLLSACGLCQGAQAAHWSEYQVNCSEANTVIGSFPVNIPSNYSVPAWAYLDVTTTDTFNPVLASQVAQQDHPDSTSSTPPTTSSPSNLHRSSHVGVIAGGVVGCLVGLGLLIATALFFYRRRDGHIGTKGERLDLSDENKPTYVLPTPYYPSQAMRIYDPSDPSTYPTSPISYQRTFGSPAPSLHAYRATSNQSGEHSRGPSNGSYQGIPEI